MAVAFFDDIGGALLKVNWERTGPPEPGATDVAIISSGPTQPPPPPPSQGSWTAHYWNNISQSGNAVLTRDESAINHDWGYSSPSSGVVANDHFSARWTRSIYFGAGSYRFTTQSDDGIRVSVGGNRIIDNWTVHALQTNTADVDLTAGTYTVVVDFYENTELATAKFWWERTSDGGGGPTGVTATTTAYWLNMRAGPSTSYSIMDVLPRGTNVSVVGRTSTSRWIQVIYQSTTGWLSTPYTTVHGDLNSVPVTG
jgi:MSHA biogenesis protein MshQ